jgi:hypothetical protein
MRVNRAGVDIGISPPDALQYMGARQYAPDISKQEYDEFVFFLRDFNSRTVPFDLVVPKINCEWIVFDFVLGLINTRRAACDRGNAGD